MTDVNTILEGGSADLEVFADGSAAFASRLDAWHQLGTIIPEGLTVDDVMTYAHLGGWNVRKMPLTTTDTVTDQTFVVPGKFATVRTNPVTKDAEALGVVGRFYTPRQNEEHAAFLQAVTDESGASFETAGSLDGGRKVFISMKLPEAMTVGGVDRVDLYLCAINSHDGTSPFTTILSPVRVVCANTLAAALHSRLPQRFTVRHTANANAAVAQAREALKLGWKYAADFQLEAEKLLNIPLTTQKFDAVLNRMFGKIEMDGREPAKGQARKIEKFDTIRGLLTAKTQENIAGTRWAAYNAITEYLDHFRPVFGADDAVKNVNRASLAIQRGMDDKALAFQLLTTSR